MQFTVHGLQRSLYGMQCGLYGLQCRFRQGQKVIQVEHVGADMHPSVVPDLVLQELRRTGCAALPQYAAALQEACSQTPPPFGMKWYGDRYRAWAADAEWMAQSLVANAAKEGEGARKLWSLAGRASDNLVAELVRRHAIDEARHSQFYIALLQLAFPEAVDRETLAQLHRLSPGYSTNDVPARDEPAETTVVLDELIQMNIGEIRTLIHQMLMRPILYLHCVVDNQTKLSKLLDSLRSDEAMHIKYTAELIESAASADAPLVRSIMMQRMSDFNKITLSDVGEGSYD